MMRCGLLIVTTMALLAHSALAGEPDKPSYDVSLYLWGSGVDGDVTARGTSSDIDASFSDILDHLNVAGMATAQLRWRRWSVLLDLLYLELESDTATRTVRVSPGPGSGIPVTTRRKVELEQAFVDLKGGYALVERPLGEASDPQRIAVDVLAGGRWWYLEPAVDVQAGPFARSYEDSQDWVDPLLGGRLRVDLTERWRVALMGDFGGFGIGSASDSTWQLVATLRWRVSERWGAFLGYRMLDVERDIGASGEVDLQLYGPLLGAGLSF